MNIHIKKIRGRLGNFLRQISNALYVALYYDYNIILPKHKFINTQYVVINNNVNIEAGKLTCDDDNYLTIDKICTVYDKTIFNKNTDKVMDIMKDIFIIQNIPPLENNSLVIHIRSGDIFSIRPHPRYVSPPLSYYRDIIEQGSYNIIYLIAEDISNPCINKLLELYPNIIFKLQTLEEDINIILAATNIVISVGTFIETLVQVSNNIKKVYVPSYCRHIPTYFRYTNKFITHVVDLEEYYKIMMPWKNTAQQRIIMLEYKY